MCLTIPAKILEVREGSAVVSVNGKPAEVLIGISDKLSIGDYVLMTGDYLIKKIDETEAQEIIDLLRSTPSAPRETLPDELREVMQNAAQNRLRKDDIEYILNIEDQQLLSALYAEANTVRKANIKDHICVHGIIEFSNYCRNNCAYCGLRCDNKKKKNYRMAPEEIIATAVDAVNNRGYKILVLQSGEDLHFTKEILTEIINKIKESAKCFIYLSIGDRPEEEYLAFKEAGANGVLYRFETSNPELFASLHPGHTLSERLEQLRMMKRLDYVLSTGMIVGLPGQTKNDLANDIMLIKELGTFMPSIGPLIATQNTPLQNAEPIDFDLMLKVIAALRLHLKEARLPVTTAMETLGGGEDARQKCFMAGANSIMFNLTPDKYRAEYHIYDHKFYDAEKRYEKWALFKGDLSYEMLENELGFSI